MKREKLSRLVFGVSALLFFTGCQVEKGGLPSSDCVPGVLRYRAEAVASYPHPSEVFTEGFVVRDQMVYESFGPKGKGGVIRYRLGEEKLAGQARIEDPTVFPEGLTWHGDRLIQITEQHHVAHAYDPATLRRLDTRPIEGTGWGLASDGESLIRSDGTDEIHFHDPETLAVTRTIRVREGDLPRAKLNELEWVDGRIYANVWFKNEILVIDPASGKVEGTIDTSPISARELRIKPHSVINGIALDRADGKLYLTGKRWSRIYEVKLKLESGCEMDVGSSPALPDVARPVGQSRG